MPVKTPLPDILEALHENQLALADAVESVAMWIDRLNPQPIADVGSSPVWPEAAAQKPRANIKS